MSYWYNWFSWWWVHDCSKHVEYRNKHIRKRIVRQNCLFTRIHSFPLQLWKPLGRGTWRHSNYSVANRSKPPNERDAQVGTPSAPVPFGRTSFLKIQVCGDVAPCRLVKLPVCITLQLQRRTVQFNLLAPELFFF